ncbi:MAG: hypothetical protein PHW08_05770 [Kiritimatiellae bacterium]|nr:hypothetical protein [Kiritimatiellia bacterium]
MTKMFLGPVLLTLLGACVAGAQTGGTVVYSNAFANASGWRPWPGNQTLAIDREVFRVGTGSLRVAAPASTAYIYWDLKPEMRYRLAAWVRHGGSMPVKSKFHLKFNKDGMGNGSAGDQALPLPPASPDASASDWREVVLHFDTPPETARAQFLALAGQKETLWIDSLTLTEEQSVAVVVPPPTIIENADLRVSVSAAGAAITAIDARQSGRALFSAGLNREALALVKLPSSRQTLNDLFTVERADTPGRQVLLARCKPTSGAFQGFEIEKRIVLPDSGARIDVEVRLIAPKADLEPWVFNYLPVGARRQAVHWAEEPAGYAVSTAGGDVTLDAPRGRGLAITDQRGLGLLAYPAQETPARYYLWKGAGETTMEWPMRREPGADAPVWTAVWTLLPFETSSLETPELPTEPLLKPLAVAWRAAAAERLKQEASGPVGTIPPRLTEIPRLPSDQSGFLLVERAEAEASAFQGLPTPVAFGCINPRHKPALILELPADMRLHGGIRGLTFSDPEETVREGKPYKRHRITMANPAQMWCRILWSSERVFETPENAYYWAEWGGGQKQPEQTFALRALPCPDVKPPERMPTYLSLPSDLAEAWLKSGADPTRLGLNMIDIWPYTRGRSASGAQGVRRIMELARPLNLNIGAWAGEWWWADARSRDPEGKSMDWGGRQGQQLCPTYRGRYFQELLDHGHFLIDLGIRRHVFDPEIYGGPASVREVCYCARCREAFAAWSKTAHPGLPAADPRQFMQESSPNADLRAAWLEFRAMNYAAFFATYRQSMEAYLAEKHPEDRSFWMLVMNAYHRGRDSYHGHEDYRDSPLYVDSLEDPVMLAKSFEVFSPMIYPDIYANYGPYDMLLPWKDTLSLRKLVAPRDVAPILTGGYPYSSAYDSDFPSSAMQAQILEAISGGARGFGIWGVCPTDAADLQAVAKAIAKLTPVESILMEAAPIESLRDVNGQTFVKGVASEQGAAVLVSDYSTLPKTARVRYDGLKGSMSVTDLASGKSLGTITPDSPEFTVELTDDRARLFQLQQKTK